MIENVIQDLGLNLEKAKVETYEALTKQRETNEKNEQYAFCCILSAHLSHHILRDYPIIPDFISLVFNILIFNLIKSSIISVWYFYPSPLVSEILQPDQKVLGGLGPPDSL